MDRRAAAAGRAAALEAEAERRAAEAAAEAERRAAEAAAEALEEESLFEEQERESLSDRRDAMAARAVADEDERREVEATALKDGDKYAELEQKLLACEREGEDGR